MRAIRFAYDELRLLKHWKRISRVQNAMLAAWCISSIGKARYSVQRIGISARSLGRLGCDLSLVLPQKPNA